MKLGPSIICNSWNNVSGNTQQCTGTINTNNWGGKELKFEITLEDSKGNIYAGTGNQGKLFRISQEGQSSLFYDSPEVSILSLAVDADDNVYAGTGPDGV